MALTNPGTVIIDRTTSMVIEGVYEFDRVDGGTLVAPAGSSFPDPAVAGEFFWRSDLSKLYRRNDGNDAWEAQAALTNPMTTKGDIIFGSTAGAPDRLGAVTGGYLRSGGASADPTFTRYLDVDSLIASVSVGATPDASAAIQADSTSRGVLITRMTTEQRDAISSPATGLLVYLTDDKRFSYYDGVYWRRITVARTRVVTVSEEGAGDFETITAALASITDAADDKRYQIEVAPGEYGESFTLKDYIGVVGYGWDTYIEGTISCTDLLYTSIENCRVLGSNAPALICDADEDGEINVLRVFLQSEWDDSEGPSVVRRTIDVQAGTIYLYRECEGYLTVTDTTNVAASTKQAVYYATGSGFFYMESFNTFHYLDTDNPGNTVHLVLDENTNVGLPRSKFLITGGDTRTLLTGIDHANLFYGIYMDGCDGRDALEDCGVFIEINGSNTAALCLIGVHNSPSGGHGVGLAVKVQKDGMSDSQVYAGEATHANDLVSLSHVQFQLDADVKPGRRTAGGSAGTFRYSLTNDFGTSWASGLFNDAEVGADVTDWDNVSGSLGGQAGANTGYIFRSDGAGSGTMVKNVQTLSRRVTVGASGDDVDYTSISAGIQAAITGGASASSPWAVIVEPGTYTESPMTVPAGVIVTSATGDRPDTVFVVAQESDGDLFTMTGGVLIGMRLSGVTDAQKCLVRCAVAFSQTSMRGIYVRGCSTGVIVENGATVIINNFGCTVTAVGQEVGTALKVTGSGSYCAVLDGTLLVPSYLPALSSVNPIQTGVRVADSAEFYGQGIGFTIAYKTTDADAVLADGGSIVSLRVCSFLDCGSAWHIGSSGSNTRISLAASDVNDCNLNVNIESATGGIFGFFSADGEAASMVPGALLRAFVECRDDNHLFIVGEGGFRYPTGSVVDFSDFFYDASSSGICEDGLVTDATGLYVDVEAGEGWILRETEKDTFFVEWDAVTSLALSASTTNYIFYDPVSPGIVASTSPPGADCISLAVAYTSGSAIRFLHQIRNPVDHLATRLDTYLAVTNKFNLDSGMACSEGSTARKFDVGSGSYYRSLDLITYAGATDAVFSAFYGTNGTSEQASQTELNITQYDNAGTLTAMTSGYFRADTVYVTSDGRVSVIYGTQEYATQSEAEIADLANVPTFIEPTGFVVAKIVIEQGVGIAVITDERPQGTSGGSGAGGVSVHGALAGLDADDHCFSSDTELLTRDGWVSYQDIQAKKTVALTFNKETEQLEPSLVVGRYVYDTFDSLISLRSLATEILVTPNHKMVYRTCDPKRKPGWKWQETTAEEFAKLSSAATIPVAGIGSSVEYPRPDNYLRLLAWVVTEGSEINPTKGGFGYRIAQSEGVLSERINRLLEDLGIHNGHVCTKDNIGRPVGDSEYVTTKTGFVFYVPSAYARNTLRMDLCDKIPGNHLLDLSARQFRLLLGEMILGDGNIRGRGKTAEDKPECVDEWVRTGKMPCTMTYASKNPALIDWLQAACARNGIRTKSTQTKKGLYTLNLTDRHTISKFTSEVVPYQGDVWCVSVMRNQTLVLRRKGRVFIAGNTQYLLVNGTRSMSSNINMGGNAITNVGNVDGVDVSSHASRHLPGGSDALATGVPTAVLVGASAAEGSEASFSRRDHQHGIAAAVPVTIGTTNSEGASSEVARANHVHAHGDQTVATLHASATTGANGFMSSTDKSKLDGVASGATNTPLSSTAPVNVKKTTAGVGVGTTAAKIDHQHDIDTGVAASITPGDTPSEGNSTSLARSNHGHGLPAFGTTSGTFCQGNDSRLSDARTPTAHATSHKSGGSDSIKLDELAAPTDVTTLNSTTSAHGLLPKLGGGTTNYLRADGSWATPPGSSSVFGAEFYQGSSDGESTTTSTSFQQKLRLTTGSLPVGTYRIGWFYEWGKTSLSDVEVQVQINDTVTCFNGFEEAVDAGGDQYFPRGGHYYYTGSGVLNIDLDYSQTGGGTARLRRARLEIWRVS